MAGDRHHDSAICHLATKLVTRIATCMRNGQPTRCATSTAHAITEAEGRAIVKERYKVEPRRETTSAHRRMRDRRKQAAGQDTAPRQVRAVENLQPEADGSSSRRLDSPTVA